MNVTVFWKHPYHGEGNFMVDAISAESAGREASESLPSDLAEDGEEADELDLSLIKDDLDIEVWEGSHSSRPDRPADYVFA